MDLLLQRLQQMLEGVYLPGLKIVDDSIGTDRAYVDLEDRNGKMYRLELYGEENMR